MPTFVVVRDLPGITPELLESAGVRVKSCCEEMTREGQPVRWLRSFFLPVASQSYCYFEASTREAVEEVNRRAELPHTKIENAVELSPDLY